jgi:hypothetical protein
MAAMEAASPVKWYHRPAWVLVLLFVVLGPLGLPYLWGSPRFSRAMKIALTIVELLYTAMLLGTVVEALRIARALLGVPVTDW